MGKWRKYVFLVGNIFIYIVRIIDVEWENKIIIFRYVKSEV